MMKRYTIQFVRHGISYANENNMIAGWTDVPLTENGRRKLKEVKESYNFITTDRYYSSDLQRCKETAEILFTPEHKIDGYLPEFREICFHSLDGEIFTPEQMHSFFQEWVHDKQVKDEETLTPLKERAMMALNGFLKKMDAEKFESATIVSHSGFIRGLMCALLHFPNERWNELTVPNGRGYVFTLYADEEGISGVEIDSIHHKERPKYSCALEPQS